MFLFFIVVADHVIIDILFFFLMIRRPPRSTRTDNSFPTRRSSDLSAEDHGEADHDQQRLQQCPGQSDEGLLVADRDIPPRQDKEQLAVAPEVAPVLLLCAARFDDDGAHDYLFGVCARAERGAVGLGVVRLDSQSSMRSEEHTSELQSLMR